MNAGPMITKTSELSLSSIDELPPFAEGWYFVANHESILREKLIEKTWMGQEIVVWCDAEGRICVSDAICPPEWNRDASPTVEQDQRPVDDQGASVGKRRHRRVAGWLAGV